MIYLFMVSALLLFFFYAVACFWNAWLGMATLALTWNICRSSNKKSQRPAVHDS